MAKKADNKVTVLEAVPDDEDIVVKPAGEGEQGEPEPMVIRMPVDIRNVSLTVLATVALVLFLQYAQAVIIPVVLSSLIFYVLDPIVDRLEKVKLPRVIGAALILLTLVSGVGVGLYELRDDALAVVEELPQAAQRLRTTLRSGRTRAPSPIARSRCAVSSALRKSTRPRRRQPDRRNRIRLASSGSRLSSRSGQPTI